jgi:hypothetical protein
MGPRATVLVLIAVVLVAGLYFLLHGLGSSAGSYEPQIRTYHLTVSGGRLTEGQTVLDATQGDRITLEVSANAPSTLHLHGYEKLLQAQPGSDATVTFTAARAGFFPIALHRADGSEDNVAALQVEPPR